MAELIMHIAGPLAMKRYRTVRIAAGVLLAVGIAIVVFALAGR